MILLPIAISLLALLILPTTRVNSASAYDTIYRQTGSLVAKRIGCTDVTYASMGSFYTAVESVTPAIDWTKDWVVYVGNDGNQTYFNMVVTDTAQMNWLTSGLSGYVRFDTTGPDIVYGYTLSPSCTIQYLGSSVSSGAGNAVSSPESFEANDRAYVAWIKGADPNYPIGYEGQLVTDTVYPEPVPPPAYDAFTVGELPASVAISYVFFFTIPIYIIWLLRPRF